MDCWIHLLKIFLGDPGHKINNDALLEKIILPLRVIYDIDNKVLEFMNTFRNTVGPTIKN